MRGNAMRLSSAPRRPSSRPMWMTRRLTINTFVRNTGPSSAASFFGAVWCVHSCRFCARSRAIINELTSYPCICLIRVIIPPPQPYALFLCLPCKIHLKISQRRLRLESKICRGRVVANIAHKMHRGMYKRAAVVFGGASSSRGAYYRPTPLKQLRDVLARETNLVLLDEHMTSKRCCGCSHDQSQREYTALLKPGFSSCLKARMCRNTSCAVVGISRDVNSACNIARVGKWMAQVCLSILLCHHLRTKCAPPACMQGGISIPTNTFGTR